MRILLTGGGTAGHIMPNIAIAASCRKRSGSATSTINCFAQAKLHSTDDPEFLYIGSTSPFERKLVESAGIKFESISTGKIRRYFALQNIIDLLFRVPLGFFQSLKIIEKFNPNVIFSKGGFVSVPVVLAGWILRKKIIIHESDSNPGLATRVASKFAREILTSYEETIKGFPKKIQKKVRYTGTPIRPDILKGEKEKGYELTGFSRDKPVILAMGGSLGAMKINNILWASLAKLIPDYQIIHICGHQKSAKTLSNFLLEKLKKNYTEYEYVKEDLKHFYAIADIVISRGGANSLAEIEPFGMPAIIVPLSAKYTRGDQIENAKNFKQKDKRRYKVIEDEKLNSNTLIETIGELARIGKRPTCKEIYLRPVSDIAKILTNNE